MFGKFKFNISTNFMMTVLWLNLSSFFLVGTNLISQPSARNENLVIPDDYNPIESKGFILSVKDTQLLKNATVEPGLQRAFAYKIYFERPPFSKSIKIHSFDITIKYQNDFMELTKIKGQSPVVISKELSDQGFSVVLTSITTDSLEHNTILKLSFTCKNNLKFTSENLAIVSVFFDTFLAWEFDSTGFVQISPKNKKPAFITHKIIENDNKIHFISDSVSVKLPAIYINNRVDNIPLDSSKRYNNLDSITPVVISDGKAKIEFSIGADSSFTVIRIFNSDKNEVRKILSKTMQEGSYTVKLETKDMEPGIYYIRMYSAEYESDLLKFTVEK